VLHRVPIYEYRCPNGHTFERFQSMTAPAPEQCDVCAASPVELVLYPVAIHYKGSGFYSTDYGKGAKKDGGEGGGGGESKPDTKTESKPESKPAETTPKPKPAASGD
jgi:putative FmdB family regulatory protein